MATVCFFSCVPCSFRSHYFVVSKFESSRYCLTAFLDNADNNTLAYLAQILPSLSPCNINCYKILIKNDWSATSQVWRRIDTALLQLTQGRESTIVVGVDVSDGDAPSWEKLPYACMRNICAQMLPKCFAEGKIAACCRNSEVWCQFRR